VETSDANPWLPKIEPPTGDAVATRLVTLPPKLYFRIGEVAELVGVQPHVLRYWEREFRTIRPSKSAKGQRVYSRRDVETLMRVRDLLYHERFTIAGARQKLGQVDPTAGPPDATTREEPEPEPSPPDAVAGDHGDLPLAAECGGAKPGGQRAERMRDDLLAIRADVQAFLAELDRPPER
jgi:DNA-binding transcriptional MerR regulator